VKCECTIFLTHSPFLSPSLPPSFPPLQVFHWRYNIPALAENHRVYAIDLLGFGLSAKPLTEYNAEVRYTPLVHWAQVTLGRSFILVDITMTERNILD